MPASSILWALQPLRRPVILTTGRLLGVALTASMGWIHLRLWMDGYREVPVIGTLFLINAVCAAVLAVLLLAVPARLHSTVAAATVVFTGFTLAGLIISLTIGLFGVHESLRTPFVPTTLIVESAGVLVLALTAMLLARAGRSPGSATVTRGWLSVASDQPERP